MSAVTALSCKNSVVSVSEMNATRNRRNVAMKDDTSHRMQAKVESYYRGLNNYLYYFGGVLIIIIV